MKRFGKNGFTMVEMLIASAVLTIFLVAGYKVFVAISRSFQKGSWSLATQNKLRNGLTFIREEMQKATYKTDVKLDGTVITKDGYKFHLNSNDEITNNAEIAAWKICMPFVDGDTSVSPGAIFECSLELKDGKLLYTKTLKTGSDPQNKERLLNNYMVVEDVAKITLGTTLFDPDDPEKGSLISVEIEIRHPDTNNFANTHVIDRTGAKVELEVKADL
jgi:prepilin-type N-terminal cleavage/methylation domain-containing protein